jgi:hypothetical protein
VTWERGRTDVERLIREGGLERVEPSSDVAARLMTEAEAHLRLSKKGVDDDPAGALQLAYDAARKACAALLAVQGLRATTQSGHKALLDAAQCQFDDRGRFVVFGRLNRLRRRRHASEYPTADSPSVTSSDAEQALRVGNDAVDAARELLASGRLSRFD